MEKLWTDLAWEQYTKLIDENKRMIKKINDLLKDIERNGLLNGKGNPEQLKGNEKKFFERF